MISFSNWLCMQGSNLCISYSGKPRGQNTFHFLLCRKIFKCLLCNCTWYSIDYYIYIWSFQYFFFCSSWGLHIAPVDIHTRRHSFSHTSMWLHQEFISCPNCIFWCYRCRSKILSMTLIFISTAKCINLILFLCFLFDVFGYFKSKISSPCWKNCPVWICDLWKNEYELKVCADNIHISLNGCLEYHFFDIKGW